MDYPIATLPQLPAYLRALRKTRGLTQADLGRLLGVRQSRIADIEADPGSISVAQLHKVLALLGTQLVLRQSAPSAPASPPKRPSTRKTLGGHAGAAPSQHAPQSSPAPPPSGQWAAKGAGPADPAGGPRVVIKRSRGRW